MKWNAEANEAISKVPFFVRKRVRRRVEEEAARGALRRNPGTDRPLPLIPLAPEKN
ncbi:MAG: hypothetical protein Q7W38_12220 [Deltaproteobacteria bacterium]|nr:hypothetical protein [Deltaproteobacteria bacterium]